MSEAVEIKIPPLSDLTYSKVDFGTDSEAKDERGRTDSTLEEADVINSLVAMPPGFPIRYHKVLLDIDIKAKLIPSSTPDHSHLYIDQMIEEETYFKLLDLLAECGIIQSGYVGASKTRGHTSLRLPWIKK